MSAIRIARLTLLTIALVCLCMRPVSGQSEIADTLHAPSRSHIPTDSLRVLVVAIPGVGSLERAASLSRTYADSDVNFSDYKYIGDLLSGTPGVFLRDLGSPGQLNGITVQGVDGRGVVFMSDGILLNEPMTGIFNPHLLPTETIERLEIVTGTQAFLYGLNSTGGVINVVTKSKKALHPYSRIRYSESAYGYGYIDGLVSQDIVRGLNVTTGFQHVTFDGRFPNSDDDSWNARAKVRYNISSRFNIYLSEDYNQTQLGMNGGVDTTTPLALRFGRFEATMRNTDSYDKITRHDLQLGAAARPFADSEAVMMLTMYHSTNLREYRDEENRPGANGLLVKQDHWSQWYGARLLQSVKWNLNDFFLGVEIQSRGVIASPATGQRIETATSVFGKDDFQPTGAVKISAYGRFDRYLGHSLLSYGSDATVRPVSSLEFFGGYARSFRFPTVQELYWRDSIVMSQSQDAPPERHHLWQLGIRLLTQDDVSFELSLFHRTVFDAIDIEPSRHAYPFPTLAYVVRNRIILQGCTATARFRAGSFWAEGSLQYLEQVDDVGIRSFLPRWGGTGGIYFWDKLVQNHLELKAGLRGRFVGSYRGTEFNPQALAYVPSSQPDVDVVGTVDAVIIAHLGSAYIHFIWENLLDRKYIVVPFYPMPDRALRFGLSWEFTD